MFAAPLFDAHAKENQKTLHLKCRNTLSSEYLLTTGDSNKDPRPLLMMEPSNIYLYRVYKTSTRGFGREIAEL